MTLILRVKSLAGVIDSEFKTSWHDYWNKDSYEKEKECPEPEGHLKIRR